MSTHSWIQGHLNISNVQQIGFLWNSILQIIMYLILPWFEMKAYNFICKIVIKTLSYSTDLYDTYRYVWYNLTII